MNIEKLLKAIELNQVYVDGNLISEVFVYDILGDPENEILYLRWDDSNGLGYSLLFTEKALSEARIVENKIYAKNNRDEEIEISLFTLTPANIEI